MTGKLSFDSFFIRWSSRQIEILRKSIRNYEWPSHLPQVGWELGCDVAFLKRFCTHVAENFNFDASIAQLNKYPQFLASVSPDMRLHVVHVQGEAGGRRPLLLIHGWPGSVYQFWPIIEPLAFPSRSGGRSEDAFDLIIPSLPGFGYSDAPAMPIGARTAAGWLARLLREVLGYREYLVAGTDWGVTVAPWMSLEHGEGIRGIHLDYAGVQPSAEPQTDEERLYLKSFQDHEQRLGGYSLLQSTRPQSLAYGMAGDVVAQAAWILERFHDWTDLGDRAVDDVFALDALATNLMLYVMPDRFATATWFYRGSAAEAAKRLPENTRVKHPSGFSLFADPRHPRPPRSWVEKGYNVKFWREHSSGGHFAAMQVPNAVVSDLREWSSIVLAAE